MQTHSLTSATAILAEQSIDVLVLDLNLLCLDVEFLKTTLRTRPNISILFLAQWPAGSETQMVSRATPEYHTKAIRIDGLRAELACREQRVKAPDHSRSGDRAALGNIVGGSRQMNCVYRTIEKVAAQNHSVLIFGESGTGKELVAREIHNRGARQQGAFVPVDCSAISPSLIESELFGHVRGAFTGAMQSRQGLLEAANGGTLFLDEIGEMPLEMQSKLLRATQERQIRPVGTNQSRPIDVRVIAATSRDLYAAIKSGTFRLDLFFRLNVIQIHLPALRERKSDIPSLAALFLKQGASPAAPALTISASAIRRLMAYDWPGNVRELQNVIARGAVCSSGDVIEVGDLPGSLDDISVEPSAGVEVSLPLTEVERRAIFLALANTGGDKCAASKILGIGRTTLYRKLKQYGAAAGSVN